MSGLVFTARIKTEAATLANKWLITLHRIRYTASEDLCKTALDELKAIHPSFDFIQVSSLRQLSVQVRDNYFEIRSEYPEIDIDFFERLVGLFDKLGVEEYRARLFDSSSGGVQIWMEPEQEIEFEDKIICVLEVDEEEGIHELLEEMGAKLVSAIEADTDIIVFADSIDIEHALTEAGISSQPILISEAEFWDFIPEM